MGKAGRKQSAVSSQQSGKSKGEGKDKGNGKGRSKSKGSEEKRLLDPASGRKGRANQDGALGAEADADEGVGGTAGGGAGATKSGSATKGKGSGRKHPRTTLKENLPEIAAAMAERAKAGSYLHARALTDLVEASEVRRQKTRRDKRLVEELLERLGKLGCGCGKSSS